MGRVPGEGETSMLTAAMQERLRATIERSVLPAVRAALQRNAGALVLFLGPGADAKRYAGQILADSLSRKFVAPVVSGAVTSRFIGETEKNLDRILDAASAAGAVLFFDEADALFGKRTDIKDAHDRYANQEVSYLLQRLEDLRGLAILATNSRTDVDRTLLTRAVAVLEIVDGDDDD
jgi:SpoVK/Ycf46/Vps4 family AAA+-type ATPase